MRRREFVLAGAAAAAPVAAAAPADMERRICLFTKYLDRFFDVTETARMLRELGVSGPDLTVRPGGMIEPERASEDLPRAVAICKEHGLTVPLISTAITSAGDPVARALLKTAAGAGIRYYKPGYYRYKDLVRWRNTLDAVGREVEALARLGRELGIRGGFHQHSGELGGSLWDGMEILERVDPKWMGLYFDVGHATIEGGKLGWKLGLQRSAPRVVMIAIKDYVWERTPKGWGSRWVPLGEGMVDWSAFFSMLRNIEFPGPISLHMHIEDDIGGATKAARYDKCQEAAARDLKFLRQRIREAYA